MGVSRAPPVHHRARPAARRAAGLLPCADDRRGPAPSSRRTPPRPATSPAACSGRWAPTAGSASAGRSEYGGQGRRPRRAVHLLRRGAARRGCRSRSSPSTPSGRRSCATAPTSRSATSCPGSSRGEIHFAIGYTEPEAGTDLAVAAHPRRPRRRRVRRQRQQGLHQRRATSADYVWLACRTDPDAPKHKGISILIVPTDSPGLQPRRRSTPSAASSRPPPTTTTCACRRRTSSASVNGGWRLITTQLNHERVGPGRARRAAPSGCATSVVDVVRPRQTAIDRRAVGAGATSPACHARLEAMKLLNWQMAAAIAAGTLEPADASAVEGLRHRDACRGVPHAARGARGGRRGCASGSPGAVLRGEVERGTRVGADQHVRRRRERGAARDRRRCRPRAWPGADR